jgi:hypothetical protein
MSPEESSAEFVRLYRIERRVRFALCVLPMVFSLQIALVGFSVPVFEAMFADFGTALPGLTNVAIKLRVLWFAVSVAGIVAPILIVRNRRLDRPVVLGLGICGLASFALAQALTLALFLPIFELGKVADGL